MTRKEAAKVKRKILGLNWDANRKRAKAVGLSQKLTNEAHKHARFTAADYKAFFESRRIAKR